MLNFRILFTVVVVVVVVVFPSSAIDSKTGCLIKKVVCGIFLYLHKDGFRLIIFNIYLYFFNTYCSDPNYMLITKCLKNAPK